MRRLNPQHASLSDPVRMAMSYAQDGVERKRLAVALRWVHDDPNNVANPSARPRSYDKVERGERLMEAEDSVESSMRRGASRRRQVQERTELPRGDIRALR
ncbi:hypothetical protein ACHAW5_001508 [Stephanodiscus triporus]|uniref:Uncharacterized protein n=1 Tax=Stephanodiscus triporus TaxID=2934178 RepID=A0ABD3NWS3_9STRA